jgi:AAA domain/Bifunctional DNA primase/polymerase, N-terminal
MNASALDIALSYIAEGWAPLPIPYRTKHPAGDDAKAWGALRVTASSAPAHFNGAPQNVGVILGEASKGLTDVDLDCPEAIVIARYLLPPTRCFGRPSKPMSHWLYYTDLWKTADKATIPHKEGTTMLVECRIGAASAQTIFPGSTHPSGETIEWCDRNAIKTIGGDELLNACKWIATLSLFARHFPRQGGRHDAGLVMGSFFARCGLAKPTGALYAEAVAIAAGQDRDKTKDIARAAGDTVADHAAGKRNLYGYPALVTTFGADIAKKCTDWGGFGGSRTEEPESLFSQAADVASIKATLFDFVAAAAVGPRESLYGGHYIRQFLSTTIAPSKVGKSSLIICEALAMASGKPLLGVTPDGPLRVWMWNGEDPIEELQRRIVACMRLYGLTPEDISDRLFVDSGRKMPIVLATQQKSGAVIAEPVERALISTIQENHIDVFQVDPFISSHRVSENDNNAIDVVAKRWGFCADVTRCAIEIPHHSRKLNGMEISVEDGRGASALLAAVRSSRALARMTAEESARHGLQDVMRRLFRFTEVSSNLSIPAPESQQWMELASINLHNGIGDDMDKVIKGDSVGVVRIFDMPAARDQALKVATQVEDGETREQAALAAVRAYDWRDNVQANDWVGIPIAQAMGIDRGTKEGTKQVETIIKAWLKSGKLIEITKRTKARQAKVFVTAQEQTVTEYVDLFNS